MQALFEELLRDMVVIDVCKAKVRLSHFQRWRDRQSSTFDRWFDEDNISKTMLELDGDPKYTALSPNSR